MQPKTRYHHGDLAHTLIAVAIDLIEEKGASGLSLREVARMAGVSHGAPAHHFRDKTGLLTAIAVQGLRELAETLQLAGEARPAAGYQKLIGSGEAYIRFSLEHPAYYAVMYRPDLVNPVDPDYALSTRLPGKVLTQFIEQTLLANGQDVSPKIVAGAAIALWSQVHGFASIWASGNLGDPDDSELLTETMHEMFHNIVRF